MAYDEPTMPPVPPKPLPPPAPSLPVAPPPQQASIRTSASTPPPTAAPPQASRTRVNTRILLALGIGFLAVAIGVAALGWSLYVRRSDGFAGADLSGLSVSVSTRDVPENNLLGYMFVVAYESAGAKVESQVGAGSAASVRRKMMADRIDASVEYNGLAWSRSLSDEDPPTDPAEFTKQAGALDRDQNGIVWLGRSTFNNAYGFAAGPQLAEEQGPFTLDSMVSYLRGHPDASVCLQPKNTLSAAGMGRFEELTGFSIPSNQLQQADSATIGPDTADGTCAFSEFAATSGAIVNFNLTLVESDDQLEINNASATVREALYEQRPQAFDTIATAILEPLDDRTMATLNARVANGEDPAAVAKDYLSGQGLM